MKARNLHVQNIFDALNTSGNGVNAHLKLKCLHLLNRSVLLVRNNDTALVTSDCPIEFQDYIMQLKGLSNTNFLRFTPDLDPQSFLGSKQIFEEFEEKNDVESYKKDFELFPYIHSSEFYRYALQYGWKIEYSLQNAFIQNSLSEKMNDKEVLYNECKNQNVPHPFSWVVDRNEIIESVIELLEHNPKLFIRQTKSGGGLGNVSVEKRGNKYQLGESGLFDQDLPTFRFFLDRFAKTSYSDKFIISQTLDVYASPGTLFYVSETEIKILSHTLQLLDSTRRFTGFSYPILDPLITKHYEAIESAIQSLLSSWKKRGFLGYGNIDWMVTVDGQFYIAERNARQTAVVAPLTLVSDIFGSDHNSTSLLNINPAIHMISQDSVEIFSSSVTFQEVYDLLESKNLLFDKEEQSGVIITIPPSSYYHNKSIGLLSISDTARNALLNLNNALQLLGKENSTWDQSIL